MKSYKKHVVILLFLLSAALSIPLSHAQQNFVTHTRGKLWETLYNWGFIGDPATWDYHQVNGVGFYPGFPDYFFPSDEQDANSTEIVTNANFHNFRSGPWIIVKDALGPMPPEYQFEPRDFLLYHSSLATGDEGVLPNLAPFVKKNNFNGRPDFNPLLPEEIAYCSFHTATGITVSQTSMAWSYPGYHDFIIYDFVFKNTGNYAIPAVNRLVQHDQTLNEVWIVFHSGIQVSTKGLLNFHYNPDFLQSAAPAGGFGWHASWGYTDYYAVENNAPDGKGLLYYSRDYNGGREPVSWDTRTLKTNWETLLRVQPDWLPELQDPACFGFVFLYRTPFKGAGPDPYDADPKYFNIYSDEGEKFQSTFMDFENFGLETMKPKQLYEFATHSFLPENNGDLYCWYTSSFGPYTLAPGDSVRLVLAEVAGVMDLKEVQRGDPNHWFPDSSIADIRRNADAARRALKWGLDVPEPPPAPNAFSSSVSAAADMALISVRWDKLAEETVITDGSGGVFYDGATDLSGYRIYRGWDPRGIWDLVTDIPRSEFDRYWNEEKGLYEYIDRDLQFGSEFSYYVQAYNANPKTWTSANGTVVEGLPELYSDDYNRTPITNARPGPVDLEEVGWDVFVVPNPYVEDDPVRSFEEPNPRKIEFRNLPQNAIIKIFNLSGDLIRVLSHGPDQYGNLLGSIAWDQRSDSGLLVAPGLYVYVVESETPDSYEGKRASGKLMIIR